MPTVQDYSADEEEDDAPAMGGGGRLRGAATGVAQTEPSKQQESGFIPWDRYVSANADVSKREADKLAGGVSARAKGVESELDAAGKQQQSDIGSNYVQPTKPAGPAFGSIAPQSGGNSAFGANSATAIKLQAADPFAPPPRAMNPDSKTSPPPAQSQSRPQHTPVVPLTAKQQAAKVQTSDRSALTATADQRIAAADQRLPARQPLDPDRLKTDVSSGKPVTTADGLKGAKDLEAQMGAGWQDFLDRAMQADKDAGALGDESGVEALLKRDSMTPDSAFDAALLSGAGGDQFRDIAKQYGGGALGKSIGAANEQAQGNWAQLMGDVDAASKARDAEINAANVDMNRLADEQATLGSQQDRDADAAANRKELEDSRTNFANGISAYTSASQVPGGTPGSVNGLGTAKQFLDALKSGAQYGDGVNWENTPGVKEQMDAASAALGISPDKLAEYFERMDTTEWIDFWTLGVVPAWMEGVTAYGYGKPGGWKAPYLENVAQYGDDGGMWNAITNMWKESAAIVAEAAVGGPAGAAEGAVKAGTYKGPGSGKK